MLATSENIRFARAHSVSTTTWSWRSICRYSVRIGAAKVVNCIHCWTHHLLEFIVGAGRHWTLLVLVDKFYWGLYKFNISWLPANLTLRWIQSPVQRTWRHLPTTYMLARANQLTNQTIMHPHYQLPFAVANTIWATLNNKFMECHGTNSYTLTICTRLN